jgi:calcineurin-like phosphoesterase
LPAKFEAASGPGRLNAVVVTADPATGKATAIERLNLSAQDVEALAGASVPAR